MGRLWVGVERIEGDRKSLRGALRLAITTATERLWQGRGDSTKWVLPAGPATHAFCAAQDDLEQSPERIDATVPRVHGSPWSVDGPTALWEVLTAAGVDAGAGLHTALLLKGRVYDVPELATEAVALLCPPLLVPVIPWSLAKGLVICTGAVCRCLEDAGGPARDLGRQVLVADHYPEELGQALRRAQGERWLRRVRVVETLDGAITAGP